MPRYNTLSRREWSRAYYLDHRDSILARQQANRDGKRADHLGSVWLSIGGPISLVIALALSDCGAHGISWRRDKIPPFSS